MKIRILFFLLLWVMRSVSACELVDDTGQTLHLQHKAERIISLAPDLTEILFTVGAGNNIVGVMRGSDYPAAAKTIRVIANYNSIDSEAILSLHPDLIVSWTDVGFREQLKKLQVPVYFSHPKKIGDIPNTMRNLACLTGNEKEGEKAAHAFLEQYQHLKNQYEHKPAISVFYQVWSKPLITIGQDSWINELISLCGGKNIFAGLKGSAKEVTLESVVVANPTIILGTDLGNWHAWSQVSAVHNHHLIELNTDLIERAGPRILLGAQNMCRAIDSCRVD